MSKFFGNQIWQNMRVMEKEKDGGGGGGGTPDAAKEMADLKASNAALMARLDALEKTKPDPEKESDLAKKAADQKKTDDDKAAESKKLEAALKFDLASKEWLKTNQSLLPKNVEGIFTAAEKEKYNSAVDKAAAIKTGIVQTFFEIQSNVELLTPGLKSALEDWQKLTNTKKQEQAEAIYQTVFEPAFEMLIRVKKAEKMGQGGGASETDASAAYKKRLMDGSKKHYMGDKHNA